MMPAARGEKQGQVAQLVLGTLVDEWEEFSDAFGLSAAYEF